MSVLKSLIDYTAKHQDANVAAVVAVELGEGHSTVDPTPMGSVAVESDEPEQKESKEETQADIVEKAKDLKSKMEVAIVEVGVPQVTHMVACSSCEQSICSPFAVIPLFSGLEFFSVLLNP